MSENQDDRDFTDAIEILTELQRNGNSPEISENIIQILKQKHEVSKTANGTSSAHIFQTIKSLHSHGSTEGLLEYLKQIETEHEKRQQQLRDHFKREMDKVAAITDEITFQEDFSRIGDRPFCLSSVTRSLSLHAEPYKQSFTVPPIHKEIISLYEDKKREALVALIARLIAEANPSRNVGGWTPGNAAIPHQSSVGENILLTFGTGLVSGMLALSTLVPDDNSTLNDWQRRALNPMFASVGSAVAVLGAFIAGVAFWNMYNLSLRKQGRMKSVTNVMEKVGAMLVGVLVAYVAAILIASLKRPIGVTFLIFCCVGMIIYFMVQKVLRMLVSKLLERERNDRLGAVTHVP